MDVKADPLLILRLLGEEYPRAAETSLAHKTPFQLLIATMLSAQCTDARVNIVTAGLFKKYGTPEDFANARIKDLEKEVRSTGFYRNKAKNIKAASTMIVEEFGGKVPDKMEDLIRLPGVARKTANIVLTAAYGKIEGIAVDTHVQRLAQRIGLAVSGDPKKIEQELMAKLPRKNWPQVNRLLVAHGRKTCQAKKPDCRNCIIAGICPKIGVKP